MFGECFVAPRRICVRPETDPQEPGLTRSIDEPLWRCARGEVPPNVALMHLFMIAPDPASAQLAIERTLRRLGSATEADRLTQAQTLWRAMPGAWTIVKSTLAGMDHEAIPTRDVTHWRDVFDRAAAVSPEAGVALYSLGDQVLLEAATAEIVERMREWGLLDPQHVLLEIGCGIGRCVSAVAASTRYVLGMDISNAMLNIARERCAALPNACFVRTSGNDLSAFAACSVDVIYAIDCFPYFFLTNHSLAPRHVEESLRVLRPGGKLLILNYSYRGEPELDREDLRQLATTFGFRIIRNGTRDFSLWDGLAFLLLKRGEA
jgi:ubiquinone/menaquinone biosynthesis C-methylase UbiE